MGTLVLGALAFWGPDILVKAVSGGDFGRGGVLLLTLLAPTSTLFALRWHVRHFHPGFRRWLAAWVMLFGVWIFGPLCMMVSSSFSGGGFVHESSAVAWHHVMEMTLLFLPMTFMMATYDGTLGALMLVSGALALLPFWRGLTEELQRNHGAA